MAEAFIILLLQQRQERQEDDYCATPQPKWQCWKNRSVFESFEFFCHFFQKKSITHFAKNFIQTYPPIGSFFTVTPKLHLHNMAVTYTTIAFTIKMEYVSKITIFGLKMTVKNGLEKIILKSLQLWKVCDFCSSICRFMEKYFHSYL